MPKLNIGFVFDDSLDKPDGVQQYVLILGQWLAAQGHRVHYLVGETARTDLPNLHSLSRNVNVRFNHNRMAIPLPARVGPIREVLARERFDVLHVQVPYSPALAARIIKNADASTAVVGTFHIAPHSGVVSLANRALGVWVRSTLRRFDAMLATSEPARQFARKTFHIDSQVAGLPLPLEPFMRAKPFARYARTKNVVFIGRLVERKGCQYLLRAVAYAYRNGQWPADAKVIVCGGGHLEKQLHAQAAAAGLHDIVEFVGYISEADKPRYVASADIAIYPSTGGESFGVVLLEGMAGARGAVLAGDNPGYASVMASRPQNLFNPHNTATLARKLTALLADDAARTLARDWQRQHVRQYDVAAVGARTVAVYEQALHNRQQSAIIQAR